MGKIVGHSHVPPDAKEIEKIKKVITAGICTKYIAQRFHRSPELIKRLKREMQIAGDYPGL